MNAETTSGFVNIEFVTGPVDVRDAGGDIRIDKADSGVKVRTTSGAIRIGLARGRIQARNAGGPIEIAGAGDAVDAETTSGRIETSFLTAPREDCRLSVAGGDIDASVPPGAALDVDARTIGGSVESELPITVRGQTRDGTLQGQLNGGGPKLSLRATGGNIRLKRSSSSPVGTQAGANH